MSDRGVPYVIADEWIVELLVPRDLGSVELSDARSAVEEGLATLARTLATTDLVRGRLRVR